MSGELMNPKKQDQAIDQILQYFGQPSTKHIDSVVCKETRFSDGRIERTINFYRKSKLEKVQQYFVLIYLAFVVFGSISICYQIYYDIQSEREIELQNAQVLISSCREDYYRNFCDPDNRVPSTEQFCIEKEQCMLANAQALARTKSTILAVIGKNLNKFFEELSLKSLSFLLTFGIIISQLIVQVIKPKI